MEVSRLFYIYCLCSFVQQAKSLGKAMKDIKLDALVASDLKRANWTVSPSVLLRPIGIDQSSNS
jgi:broad specificity phosphatase PhoE